MILRTRELLGSKCSFQPGRFIRYGLLAVREASRIIERPNAAVQRIAGGQAKLPGASNAFFRFRIR